MTTVKTASRPLELVTVDQVQTDPRYRDCELWDGIAFVKEAAGGAAPFATFQLALRLGQHLESRLIPGWAGAADVGFLLRRNPDRLLSPDVAFVSAAKMPNPPARGFAEVVPDFVVEVRSPDDSFREALEKCLIWSSHGVPVVWLVDPIDRRILAFRPNQTPVESRGAAKASAGPSLPGFEVAIDDVLRQPGAPRGG